MTEDDDAFLRTIVDSPGDDLPRLVYADWLDDRDDPRGPFLRAEVEWAQPWKDGTPPGWSKRLPGRAAPEWEQPDWPGLEPMLVAARGLDPLWVARICRPPLGVCADHVEIRDPSPHVTLQDIRREEVRLNVKFHTDYAAFLLNHNGGKLWPREARLFYLDTGSPSHAELFIEHFVHIGDDSEHSLERVMEEIRYLESLDESPLDASILERFVPIATENWNLVYLMEYHPNPTPGLVLVDETVTFCAPEVSIPSLPHFLGRVVVW